MTSTQPAKVTARAITLTGVTASRKNRADIRVTKTGEVYSSTAATDMELRVMVLK